jgi:hypothetical protein
MMMGSRAAIPGLFPWLILLQLGGVPPSFSREAAGGAATTTCRAGFRMGTLAHPSSQNNYFYYDGAAACSPCPGGVDCDTGRLCDEGTLALPASGRCCQRNLTCPAGRVLDNTACLCAPLGCAASDERLLLQPGTGIEGPLICRSPLDYPIPPNCGECGGAQALDPRSCACLAVRNCKKGKGWMPGAVVGGGGGTWWRGGDGRLVCVYA